jgi:E3 ubiquitin-protein ligase HECTD2
VTKKNQEDFVDLYVEFVLDKLVRKQFEPFARGFFSVCAGNALSLFRGEEIGLLIRGHGDIDFNVLRTAAVYENWRLADDGPELKDAGEVERYFPVVKWFWELMCHAGIADQKAVLRWITGSDRIPATGLANLTIRIQYLGEDRERLPQARTCFNMLQMYNYPTRTLFIKKFWYAVVESKEFGMK